MKRAGFPVYATGALLAVAFQGYVFRKRLDWLGEWSAVANILMNVGMAALLLLLLFAAIWSQGALPTVMASWRGITRRQLLWTFLGGCAYHGYRTIVSINPLYAQYIFVGDEVKAFGLLLFIVAADGLTGKDPDRRGAYAITVLLFVVVVGPVASSVIATLIFTLENPLARPVGQFGFYLNNFFELLMVSGAVTWVINDRRKAHRERDRMHAAELSRIDAERQSIEADLQAMQARVEPKFLFNTLSHVKRAYAHDASQGARLLDALIAYLRAAMPKMRDTSSTVRQELDLVRAYLEIVHLRMADRLTFTVDPPGGDIGEARMPAMLMLPLVDQAIASGAGEWHSEGVIRVQASVVNQKIRLVLSHAGTDGLAEDDERILGIRERLAAIYGGESSLALRLAEPGVYQAILEIPHERAPGGDQSSQPAPAPALAQVA